MADLVWTDVRSLGVGGKGWADTESFYDRLPARAQGMVPEPVWNLAGHSAGMHVRFVTNASEISARWKLRFDQMAMHHMPASGCSGLDLYARTTAGWRWLGIAMPGEFPDTAAMLADGLDGTRRELMLYLPLYNGVESVEIGLPDGASLEPVPKTPAKAMCFYGTSILQGGCASRAGMAWPSIVARRIGRDAINLGFSGNGRMEKELALLQRELDVSVYVLDCLPNMTRELIDERLAPFVRTLRESRPQTPILLIEKPHWPAIPLRQPMREDVDTCNAACRHAHDTLKEEGIPNLHYLPGDDLYGHDTEATVDGIHATDVGMLRLADTVEPVLRKLLESTP